MQTIKNISFYNKYLISFLIIKNNNYICNTTTSKLINT